MSRIYQRPSFNDKIIKREQESLSELPLSPIGIPRKPESEYAPVFRSSTKKDVDKENRRVRFGLKKYESFSFLI